MDILKNPHRPAGLSVPILNDIPLPSTDATTVQRLLGKCPEYAVTPVVDATDMARALNVGKISIKDERGRMNLGSFKALGAAYVIAYKAMVDGEDQSDKTYVTASAGNHGMSVGAGASAFGAKSVVYIAETVPEAFAHKLAATGAKVVREGAIYEDSMAAAQKAAADNGWTLLSDSSWPGYHDLSHRLMEGYTAFMAEAQTQMTPPTHVFLQAGVGGLAGAAAAMVRSIWGDDVQIIVVEPANAPALLVSIEAGDFKPATGPDSCMGRLDCKEASLIALKGLARDADYFTLVSEQEGIDAADFSETHGLPTTPSGAGGLAGLLNSKDHRAALGLDENAHVMIILSEGPE